MTAEHRDGRMRHEPLGPRALAALETLADAGLPLRVIADAYLAAVVDRCGGDRRAAAARLGVSLKSIYNRFNDERSILHGRESVSMLFAVTIAQEPGTPPLYASSSSHGVDDPAHAIKFSTIADAEIWRLDHIPVDQLDRSAVVKVCDGGTFDRSSVVLDRARAIDVGHVKANGTVPGP